MRPILQRSRGPVGLALVLALGATSAGAIGCSGELAPEGESFRYVIAGVAMPGSAGEEDMFALELEGGRRANLFGATIAGVLPLAVIANDAIQRGKVSMLLQLQTRDFDAAAASAITLHLGTNPLPLPCPSADDCGRHLDGDGLFQIASSSPAIFGSVRNGFFLSGLGNEVTIQLSFDGMREVAVPLVAARIQAAQLSDNRIGMGIIAGGIPLDFLRGRFIDDLIEHSSNPLDADCNPNGSTCQCAGESIGLRYAMAFDADGNCELDRSEVMASAIMTALSQPDLIMTGVPSVSFGMGFTATRATF